MCQQTRVETVLPYYEQWMHVLPSVELLALADEQSVLGLWQGLGYYRRAKNLHRGAKWVVENGFPLSAEEWRKVPGVGDYTAGAIASICFGEPSPVVDGNVERVFARFQGSHATESARKKLAWVWAHEVMTPQTPGEWNQGLMELGARICTPTGPKCDECPIRMECVALARGETALLPVKNARKETMDVEQKVLIEICEGELAFVQYGPGEWWTGLHGFPQVFETEPDDENLPPVRHQVTHHKIEFHPYVRRSATKSPDRRWVQVADLGKLPVAAPFRKMIKHLLAEKVL
jgi:A/G-specific adenine glycosylase